MDGRYRESAVIGLWRKGHLSSGTIVVYLHWVRRFLVYCEHRRLRETEQLTADGVGRFTRAYAGSRLAGRRSAQSSCKVACNALHAWACALGALGTSLPPWREKPTQPLSPLLTEYCQYRRAHNGVSEGTLIRDIETARGFLVQLSLAKKSIKRTTLSDVDSFVQKLAIRVAKRTVVDRCSSLRAFLRFLQITGRLPADLAGAVLAPRFRFDEQPPRTLPWGNAVSYTHLDVYKRQELSLP